MGDIAALSNLMKEDKGATEEVKEEKPKKAKKEDKAEDKAE